MNFLAHAHLAYHTQTCIVGNLLGDFTRGIEIETLPVHWQQGIRLHRKIDTFADSDAELLLLRKELGSLRRYGGIVLDILLDHIIAKHFNQLAELPLTRFSELVYKEIARQRTCLPPHFNELSTRMIEQDWLSGYRSLDLLTSALERTSHRLSRKPPLENAVQWYAQDKRRIDEIGLGFYRRLMSYSHHALLLLKEGKG